MLLKKRKKQLFFGVHVAPAFRHVASDTWKSERTTSQFEKRDHLRSTWTQNDWTVSYLPLNDLWWLEVGYTSVQLQSHSFTWSILTLRLPLNRFVVNQSPSAGRLHQFWQTISRACKHRAAKHLHSITSWKLIRAFALGLPFPSLKHKHCGWGGPAYIDCYRAPTSSTFSHSLTRGATELNTDDCRRVLHSEASSVKGTMQDSFTGRTARHLAGVNTLFPSLDLLCLHCATQKNWL